MGCQRVEWSHKQSHRQALQRMADSALTKPLPATYSLGSGRSSKASPCAAVDSLPAKLPTNDGNAGASTVAVTPEAAASTPHTNSRTQTHALNASHRVRLWAESVGFRAQQRHRKPLRIPLLVSAGVPSAAKATERRLPKALFPACNNGHCLGERTTLLRNDSG